MQSTSLSQVSDRLVCLSCSIDWYIAYPGRIAAFAHFGSQRGKSAGLWQPLISSGGHRLLSRSLFVASQEVLEASAKSTARPLFLQQGPGMVV